MYVTHDQTEAMTLGDRVAVMRAGELQQVASPAELYANPANLFVAGFIGSPAMNFMAAKVAGDTVKLPVGDVPIPTELRERMDENAEGRDVIAGLRPESFEDASLVGDDRERGTTFTAKIDLVESMGSEQFAHFHVEGESVQSTDLEDLARDSGAEDLPSAGEGQVVARLDAASEIKRGDEAEMWVDASKLHLFDPGSGESLTRA